jgi:hypothetical protein
MRFPTRFNVITGRDGRFLIYDTVRRSEFHRLADYQQAVELAWRLNQADDAGNLATRTLALIEAREKELGGASDDET